MEVFLTTDDKLLKKARTKEVAAKVKVDNPLKWLIEQEEIKNDYDNE